MNHKAVIVEIEYTVDLDEFLKYGRIVHTSQEYKRTDIRGLRKLMGWPENWPEEYRKYWGVEYVIVKDQHGWVLASGRLQYADYVGFDNKDINRYIFICYPNTLREEKFKIWDNDAIYGNWDPEKRKLVAI